MSLADEYPLRLLCRLLGIPRSSVYFRPRPACDEALLKTALLDLAAEWPTCRNLDQGLPLSALERALVVAPPKIHHSDQGVPRRAGTATAYVNRLKKLGVKLSMAAVGEPRENGYAERLMRTIKEEEVDLSDYQNFAEAKNQIGHFIDAVYNHKRIRSSLGYLTPKEFEEQWRAARGRPTTTKT